MLSLLALIAAALAAAPALAQPVPAPAGQTRQLVSGADGVQIYACEARDAARAGMVARIRYSAVYEFFGE
jgi:hypothetical protein